jgi:hypothetical protein
VNSAAAKLHMSRLPDEQPIPVDAPRPACPVHGWCVEVIPHDAHRTLSAEIENVHVHLQVRDTAKVFIQYVGERREADAYLTIPVADAGKHAAIYARLGHPELAAHVNWLAWLITSEQVTTP